MTQANLVTKSVNTISSTIYSSKSLFLYPTDHREIEKILKEITSKPTEDLYGINTQTLKSVSVHISRPLADIFNRALEQGIFPKKLKVARITPIYKKGDERCCENYRPITIQPAISKILEGIILKRIYEHFRKEHLLSPEQFAYQPGKGTEDAMKFLLQKVCQALEERKRCKVQLCDLSRAFDLMLMLVCWRRWSSMV